MDTIAEDRRGGGGGVDITAEDRMVMVTKAEKIRVVDTTAVGTGH